MKIALYLGSFNPFHRGHFKVIQYALNYFHMDKVIIVPTMQNPWKNEKVLDIDKRIKIIEISILSNYDDFLHFVPNILISDIEKKLIPPYYSYATLHALKNKYCNDEIFILCGEDTINNIPNWMHGGTIIQDYDFLIVDRPDDSISSTKIRNKIKNNEDISTFICPYTKDLIKEYYEKETLL